MPSTWHAKAVMLADTMNAKPSAANAAVKDTTTSTFRQDVLTESMNQPVLVDFWAPWCGPCKQLAPVLEKVVAATAGKVKLVKMNIDEHPQIAGQLGVQSIPAVFAFSRGQPVDGFMGALPEGEIKSFIERLVGPVTTSTDELLAEAAELVAEGDVAGAAELFGAVLAESPENVPAIAGLAKLHLDLGDLDAAKRVLATAPAKAAGTPEINGVRAAIEIAEQAGSLGDLAGLEARVAADPNDFAARFDLALGLSGLDRREEAADQLLAVVRRDRTWNEDGARKQLVQFFDAWGPLDPATVSGRRKLSSVLFS